MAGRLYRSDGFLNQCVLCHVINDGLAGIGRFRRHMAPVPASSTKRYLTSKGSIKQSGAARAAPPYHTVTASLLLRDTSDYCAHLWRSDTSRLIISRRGGEETVVAALSSWCDVMEISVRIDVIQLVEKRVRIARAAMPEAIAVGNDRRPEGR